MGQIKQFFTLILASVFGGLITLGGLWYMGSNQLHPTQNFEARNINNINVPAGATGTSLDFRVAAQKSMPAVVHISASQSKDALAERRKKTPRDNDNPFSDLFGDNFDFFFGNPYGQPRKGTGSGVIYSEDGYIITNNHVVDFADEVEVTLYDDRIFKAKVIGKDPTTDLAVIKIEGFGFPTLKIADSDKVEVGEWALAVGNPFDLNSTVTAGIISAKGRNIGIIREKYKIEEFIQTDAVVNPGNSGGALVNVNGDLIGINTAIISRTGAYAGYSFAIPTNLMKKIVDDIIEFGSSQRAAIGIEIEDLNDDNANELGLNFNKGVIVRRVFDGGSGQYAGLLPNDVIIAVDGTKIKEGADLLEIIRNKKAGDIISLKINRKGTIKELPVTLKAI